MVVTLITAGRLVSAGIPDKHFSHVFIDEAGHAMEPEACVAISGIQILILKNNVSAKILNT